MNKKIIFILVILIAVVLAVLVSSGEQKEAEYLAEYPQKKVYTTDAGADQAPFIADCESLGGTFNTCGSPCAPDAEFCTAVCAYTCEF